MHSTSLPPTYVCFSSQTTHLQAPHITLQGWHRAAPWEWPHAVAEPLNHLIEKPWGQKGSNKSIWYHPKSSKNHPKIIQNHPKSTLLLLFPQRGSQDVFFTSLHLPNSVRTIPRQAPHNKQVQACGRPPGKGGSVCNHSLILIEFNFNQNPDVHS